MKRLETKPPLIEDMIDPKVQVQDNGVDLSVRKIEKFSGFGVLRFEMEPKNEPTTETVEFDESIHLSQGAYRITYNEWVNIPKDLIAIARPRSTLLRYGATVATGVWDAGYRGRSVSLLTVHNQAGLEFRKNARVIQLVFLRLTEPVDKGYTGGYQGENR
jgi:dUTP pyrophosphatase